MSPEPVEGQLELFDLKGQPAATVRRYDHGTVQLHLRYDQLVLGGVAAVLGFTVIFACGVERGKRLVRFERMPLALQQPASSTPSSAAESASGSQTSAASAASLEKKSDAERQQKKPVPAPSMTPKPQPRKLASGAPARPDAKSSSRSRYAIQLITYSRPQLAASELARLKARGERAFLIMREGRTSVYVGPFPSRSHAAQKVALLKARYQDCFVKTL